MRIKLFQLNLYKGFRLKEVIEYIQKERFDVVTLQEVTKGTASPDGVDCYRALTQKLNMASKLSIDFKPKNDPEGYHGIVTFYSRNFTLIKTRSVRLRPFSELDLSNPDWTITPRSALITRLSLNNKEVEVINTHGAWSQEAVDTPEKIRQATILYNYLKTITVPFVLVGDLNMTLGTKVIQMYSSLATNLTEKYGVTNTINLNVHYAKEQLKDGIVVDHMFVSSSLQVIFFDVVTIPTLSDHYGLKAELEL